MILHENISIRPDCLFLVKIHAYHIHALLLKFLCTCLYLFPIYFLIDSQVSSYTMKWWTNFYNFWYVLIYRFNVTFQQYPTILFLQHINSPKYASISWLALLIRWKTFLINAMSCLTLVYYLACVWNTYFIAIKIMQDLYSDKVIRPT